MIKSDSVLEQSEKNYYILKIIFLVMEENKNGECNQEFDNIVKQIKKKREETKRKRDNPFSHIAFPMAMKVASKTLGMDLVSVQPLSMPNIGLQYIDFSYENEEDRLKREKFEKRQRVIDTLLGKNSVKVEEEKTLHVTIKDNNDSATYNHMSKWASIIESVTKDDVKRNWLNDYCNMQSSAGLI
jgi:hypothetical protein